MEQVVATIRDGETVLAADVKAVLQITSGELYGCVTLPEGTHIPAGKRCRLTTADGRSVDIMISETHAASHQDVRVHFEGMGPLE